MKKFYLIIFVLAIWFVSFFLYEKRETKILFVGDMNFDRYIRQVVENKGDDHVFSCITNFLKNYDLVVGNLEGPITDNPSVSLGSIINTPNNYTFTFSPITAKHLAKNNIKLVNLGNNHISNFGKEGFASTKKYLEEGGVEYFGGFYGDEPILRKEIKGNKISLISFNEFGGDKVQNVVEKIKNEKKEERTVFVYTHWGDEYTAPPQRIKNYAKLFAEAGADLVVGSHPHVILYSEKMGDSFVYYSLGNFIFDQYWNKEVSTGLVLEVNIKGDNIKITEHKVTLSRDGRTCLEN
jgi:poly-gamma-glutamate synthesis protein (capsule biosynthesis protein)